MENSKVDLKTIERAKYWLKPEFAKNFSRYWSVDPIDGTKGFIRGDQYSICVSLINNEDQLPILAGIGCPNLNFNGYNGFLIISMRGIGNFIAPLCKNGSFQDLKPLPKVELCDQFNKAVFCSAFETKHTNVTEVDFLRKKIGCTQKEIIRMDSQCKYVLLALNQAQIYYRHHKKLNSSNDEDYTGLENREELIWDNAPGWLVVTEAGGTVTDFHGNPILFPPKKFTPIIGGILSTALTPILHNELVEIIKGNYSTILQL